VEGSFARLTPVRSSSISGRTRRSAHKAFTVACGSGPSGAKDSTTTYAPTAPRVAGKG